MNFVASKLYNAALAGPLPAQTYHLGQTRRDLNNMREGRPLHGPNDNRILLQPDDISMFLNTIDQIEEMFRELKKTNPKWEAETKAHENRQTSFNNINVNGNGNGSGIPAGPKRARDDDDERERDRNRLDRELENDLDGRREVWTPRQQQPLDRTRQLERQRNFANQGFGSRLDNPKRRR